MVSNISQIVYQLFQKETLEEVSENELRYFIGQYPYSGMGHLLLAKKLQLAGEKRAFDREISIASIYFNNPAWLQFILQENEQQLSEVLEEKPENDEEFTQAETGIEITGASRTDPSHEGPHDQMDNLSEEQIYAATEEQIRELTEDFKDENPNPETVKSAEYIDDDLTVIDSREIPGDQTLELTGNDRSGAGNEISEEIKNELREDTENELRDVSETELVEETGDELLVTSKETETEPFEIKHESKYTSTVTENNIEEELKESFAEASKKESEEKRIDKFTEQRNDELAETESDFEDFEEEFEEKRQAALREDPVQDEIPLAETAVEQSEEGSQEIVSEEISSEQVAPVQESSITKAENNPGKTEEIKVEFDPYYTIDYFASQGIKLRMDEFSRDKLGQQLKSFTEWIRSMKRLPQQESENSVDETDQSSIRRIAEHSVEEKEVLTESMAEVWVKQGNYEKARQVYRKLSLQNPSKSTYFAAKIEQIKVK